MALFLFGASGQHSAQGEDYVGPGWLKELAAFSLVIQTLARSLVVVDYHLAGSFNTCRCTCGQISLPGEGCYPTDLLMSRQLLSAQRSLCPGTKL